MATSGIDNDIVVESRGRYGSNWVNVEDNDDLNTSNESYISTSSDED